MEPQVLVVFWGLLLLDGWECACPGGCTCQPRSSIVCRDPLMTDIYISDMELNEIPTLAFQGVPKLRSMGISNSNIGHIRARAFKGLPKLMTLHIFSSNVGSIDSYAFSELRNLERFFIYGSTTIGEINSYAFYGMRNVSYVAWYGLKITEVNYHAFQNIQQTGKFHLYVSNITTIRSVPVKASSIQDGSENFDHVRNPGCETIDVIDASDSFLFNNIGLLCDCNMAWMVQTDMKTLLGDRMQGVTCLNLPRVKSVSDLLPDDLGCDFNTGEESICAMSAQTECPTRNTPGADITSTSEPDQSKTVTAQEDFPTRSKSGADIESTSEPDQSKTTRASDSQTQRAELSDFSTGFGVGFASASLFVVCIAVCLIVFRRFISRDVKAQTTVIEDARPSNSPGSGTSVASQDTHMQDYEALAVIQNDGRSVYENMTFEP